MADVIVNEVKQHAGNTEQSDDLTLLAICYKPQKEN
jgi:serine phosphatase RsbU (regulator of sigma subunit)